MVQQEKAGRGENSYSDDEILSVIRELSNELGKSPTRSEYRENIDNPSTSTISRRFGSWNKAKKAAGLKEYEKSKSLDIPDNRKWDESEWENLSTSRRMTESKKSYLGEIKVNKGCSICGYDENPHGLTFHHREPKSKNTEKTTEWISRGWDWIESELKKCDVLCSNCHNIHHWDDGRWDL